MDNIEKIVDEVEIELCTAIQDYLELNKLEDTIAYEDQVMSEIKLEDYYTNQAVGERFLGEI